VTNAVWIGGPDTIGRRPRDVPTHVEDAVIHPEAAVARKSRRIDPDQQARVTDVAELTDEGGTASPGSCGQVIVDRAVIIDHGAAPTAHRVEHGKHRDAAPLASRSDGHQVSGQLEDCSRYWRGRRASSAARVDRCRQGVQRKLELMNARPAGAEP
jgi:hypothetical protein